MDSIYKKTSYKIYFNKDLMDYIYSYDDTYIEQFKKNIVFNLSLLEKASDFWYDKYNFNLNLNVNNNYILHLQDQFLEIIFKLYNPDFTPNINRFDTAPESNWNNILRDYY